MEEIKVENLKTLEIKQIALDKDKLGGLTFDKVYPLLDKLIKVLVDFDDLNYKEFLTIEEIKRIEGYKNSLIGFVNRIKDFDPAKDTSFNKEAKDRLETEIENFYNDTTKSLREPLTYLRQETTLKSQDAKNLEEQKKATIQAEKVFKDLSVELQEKMNQLKTKINQLKTQKSEVEKGHGDLGATRFGLYFEKQAKIYSEKAHGWLKTRNWFFGFLLGIIIVNFIGYFYLFITYKLGIKPNLSPSEFFTIPYAVAKLVLLSTISYGVGFCSKQYNVNSHLSSTNKHRQNVADTLNSFLSANPDRKSEMLKNGTEAMFKHISTGYIGKNESKEQGNIMYEVINKVLPQ